MRTWSVSWLLALLATGCDGCGSDFDFGGLCWSFPSSVNVDSDQGLLSAYVTCEPGADCSDRREVLVGSTFGFAVEVPSPSPTGPEPRIEGRAGSGVELSRYEQEPVACENSVRLSGEVTFGATGEAVIEVYGQLELIDTFTVQVYEAAALDVQVATAGAYPFGYSEDFVSYTGQDVIRIDAPTVIRAYVRNAEGGRLSGSAGFSWEVSDPQLATVSDPYDALVDAGQPAASIGDRQQVVLRPSSLGTTTLIARGGGLEVEIPLEIVGLERSDGGAMMDDDAGQK